MKKRSNEPVVWTLFGAGGVVVAYTMPVLIFITGIAVPLGIVSPDILSFERLSDFASGWAGKLFLLIIISLPLWQSAHRIFLSLHDFGIKQGEIFFRVLLYGAAFWATVFSLLLLIGM
jgi:fumarate reductase subunit D